MFTNIPHQLYLEKMKWILQKKNALQQRHILLSRYTGGFQGHQMKWHIIRLLWISILNLESGMILWPTLDEDENIGDFNANEEATKVWDELNRLNGG